MEAVFDFSAGVVYDESVMDTGHGFHGCSGYSDADRGDADRGDADRRVSDWGDSDRGNPDRRASDRGDSCAGSGSVSAFLFSGRPVYDSQNFIIFSLDLDEKGR